MYPVEPIGGGTAHSQMSGASSRQRCGNDGQRKRVAHMPTATTTKEDSRSKLVQNHPHDFTKKLFYDGFGHDAPEAVRCDKSRPVASTAGRGAQDGRSAVKGQ